MSNDVQVKHAVYCECHKIYTNSLCGKYVPSSSLVKQSVLNVQLLRRIISLCCVNRLGFLMET